MDTANKISIMSKDMGFPIVSLGIPKTVDNDLPITDNCPGLVRLLNILQFQLKRLLWMSLLCLKPLPKYLFLK